MHPGIFWLNTREQEKHEKRKLLLKELKSNVIQNEELLEKTKKQLGEEDPVYNEIEAALVGLKKTCTRIENLVERGECIEKF